MRHKDMFYLFNKPELDKSPHNTIIVVTIKIQQTKYYSPWKMKPVVGLWNLHTQTF